MDHRAKRRLMNQACLLPQYSACLKGTSIAVELRVPAFAIMQSVFQD